MFGILTIKKTVNQMICISWKRTFSFVVFMLVHVDLCVSVCHGGGGGGVNERACVLGVYVPAARRPC